MAKKGFSTARLSFKIGLLLIVPVFLMTQLPGPTGKPVLDMNSFNPVKWISQAAFSIKRQTAIRYISIKQWLNNERVTGRATVVVYRSKDKYGNWQYSQTAPAGVNAEQVKVTDRSIRMPKPSDKLSDILAVNDKKPEKTKASSAFSMSLPIDKVQGLVKDTQNIQKTLEDREAKMQNF